MTKLDGLLDIIEQSDRIPSDRPLLARLLLITVTSTHFDRPLWFNKSHHVFLWSKTADETDKKKNEFNHLFLYFIFFLFLIIAFSRFIYSSIMPPSFWDERGATPIFQEVF